LTCGHAAELDSSTQQRVRAATFEVVQAKPDEGSLEYERPLPLDLLPYQERNDKYRSIGTAFAIGSNRYVTASHVLALGSGSQYGLPAVRDATGRVHAIDQILKYSSHEDFAVFSLKDEPAGVKPLAIGKPPALNDTVFAVGNALGEGVVIRDGLHTSDTPEEINGEWQWLRFSAAASPGNSGGPLIDARGRVLGVVLRKSANENLNYALPMARVIAAADGVARLDVRTPLRLPVIDATETLEEHEHFQLPLSLAQFYESLETVALRNLEQAQARLLEHNATHLFPNGDGSNPLLHEVPDSPLPRLMRESQNGQWQVVGGTPRAIDLDHNGFLRWDGTSIRLHAPDDVPLAKLYGDSKLLMDLLLKGQALNRPIGTELIRVTSLGRARELPNLTDRYGRVWQVRQWSIPFADEYLTALCLPTPEGYALSVVTTPSGALPMVRELQQLMTSYTAVTLTGTLGRWQQYLQQQDLRLRLFSNTQLDIDPSHSVRYRSNRYQLEVTPELVKLSGDSLLTMLLSYYRDGSDVVWDVSALVVRESAQKGDWVEARRVSAPEPSLPEVFQSNWSKLLAGDFPFNATPITENAATRIQASAAPTASAGSSRVRYVLSVETEGSQTKDVMAPKLTALQRAFKPLEN
jgi:hypothetical protein